MIIVSETIKNAVVHKLLECLPDVNIYKESTSTPLFPYAVVNQLGIQCQEERNGYFLLTYNMQVQYKPSYDISTEPRLQQELDRVAMELMAAFDLLESDGEYVRCSEKSYEKVEGVLIFSFDVVFFANVADMDASEIEKMRRLIYNVIIDKE